MNHAFYTRDATDKAHAAAERRNESARVKAEEDSCRAEQARELQARIAHERKIRKRRDKQIARVKLKLAKEIAAHSPDLVARSRV